MKTSRFRVVVAFFLAGFSAGAYGLSDTGPRAMGLAQTYTALARGPEAVFWNPANLALGGGSKFSWDVLNLGFTLVAENNSFSVQTYNDNFTDGSFIDEARKQELLGDIQDDGFKLNLDIDPHLALLLPLANSGVTFKLPWWDIHSAVVLGATTGVESEIPRDIFDLMLFGNEFNRAYDIAKWDGSGWGVGSLNLAGAKVWMPAQFKPYLNEFAVGATLKLMGGVYGEVKRSDGGFASYFQDPNQAVGTDLNAYLISQFGGGIGFGLDLGAAGLTKDCKTTFSVGLLNLLDTMSWGIWARQDSAFATANDLLVTRLVDVKAIEEVLDNDRECIGNEQPPNCTGAVIFHKRLGEERFSRSLPAMLRVGGAYQLTPNLTVVGNWDQAFSNGFGVTTTPRVSAGVEYHLVPFFPTSFGLSVGGRGNGSALGFGFGPFTFPHVELEVMHMGLAARGGFFPGVSKGLSFSLMLFRLKIT